MRNADKYIPREQQEAFDNWLRATGQAARLRDVDPTSAGELFIELFAQFVTTAEGQALVECYEDQARRQIGIELPENSSSPMCIGGFDIAQEVYLRSRYDEEGMYEWRPKIDNEGRIIEVVVYEGKQGADSVTKALREISGLRHITKAVIDFTAEEDDASPMSASISDDALLPLAKWKRLEEINIVFGLAPTGALLRLSRANPLSSVKRADFRAREGACEIAKAMQSATEVIELDIRCGDTSDKDLRWLAGAVNLSSLAVDSSQLTGVGLAELRCRDTLVSISLSECPVSDDGLLEISRYGQLQRVVFSGADITDAGFKHIGELKRLRKLTCGMLPRLTNQGFATAIDQLLDLEELVLGDVPFGDEIIPLVERIPKLRRFSLVGFSAFTPEGVRRLQKKRPDCRISAYHVFAGSLGKDMT
ncbi:MAG: hypothetical protein AAFV43_10255 [Planctomycetota bacterium]